MAKCVVPFEPGNAEAMTAGGGPGALRRMRDGKEQRRDVLELKAERLQEFARAGRLGALVDKIAEIDAISSLFWDQIQRCYENGDTDGLYRASKEMRGLVNQMTRLLTEHREEENSQGGQVLDYEQLLAKGNVDVSG